MKQGIFALPEEVVHLIAAGEVLDSLAAVVRELAENALDAGATRITIALWPEQWRIRVSDNGAGMNLEDLQQAATAHSTSKIRDLKDLQSIISLGFRGEALYSLAQLSDLQIASRSSTSSRSEDEGWLAIYNHQGAVVQLQPIAIAPGTIVTANHIFANFPTRRTGLPSFAQQLRAVQMTIQQLALCHPQVMWQVQQNERDWFTLFPGTTPRQILPQLLRDVQEVDLQELQLEIPLIEIESFQTASTPGSLYLLLGLPDRCHRHRPDWIRVAVNGRFVQLPALEQTILGSFRRTLPRDRYPICLIHLSVPPEQIDWNRHPAKSEIYLHHVEEWQKQVALAIEQALHLNLSSLPEGVYSQRMGHLFKSAENAGVYHLENSSDDPTLDAEAVSSGALKAIAQVHQMYILAEHSTGIWLIEQHIAHERVLYEKLCDRWQLVPLNEPVILKDLTIDQLEQLQRIGIEAEPFGEQTWVVRSAPELLAERSDLTDAFFELSLGGDLPAAQAAIACRTAIRNGTPLTLQEMQTLLNQWQQTRNPRTCPHGRPICLTLEETSLSRFFRRHWMIGKSHGI